MTKSTKPPKMSRAQIAEALDTVPLDTILLGSRTESRLTHKQKEFARNLALGKSKAQSYREAYNSKGTVKTHAANGHKISLSAEVQQIARAYEVAIEAAKQRTPAQLRELVIHQLTEIAIGGEKESSRISALKLLGQVTEVAAFTERRETTTIRKSEDVRAALMEKLRTISGSAEDATFTQNDDGADSLLAEISKGQQDNDAENGQNQPEDDLVSADPTLVAPPSIASDHLGLDLHNVPHKGCPQISDTDDSDISDGELIGVDVHVSSYIEEIEPIVAEKVPAGDPTPSDMKTPPVKGTGE